MPNGDQKSQQLHAVNVSVNIGEALEARVKDPLWFLARQWQTGEFEAENGGRVANISVDFKDTPFTAINMGQSDITLDVAQPLESIIEAEGGAGDAPAWRSEALEYSFDLKAHNHAFAVQEYGGRMLDWYHFDFTGKENLPEPDPTSRRVTPTQLYFRGAPHPRWWRMEEGDAYFDSPEESEPNALSLLLPEFFYTDINNWYVAPLPMRSGSLREVTSVRVVDSFGIVSGIKPATSDGDEDWAIFGLDAGEGSNAKPLDGRFLLAPNIAIYVLQNDDVEEVRFLRDEDANLVWAWERQFLDDNGQMVFDGGGLTLPDESQGPNDGLPRFVLKSPTPRHWIPYMPRFESPQQGTDGEIYLRRGRTMESASTTNPQYRSHIVSESIRLNEEEITPTGLRVRRIKRYARGSDGTPHFWIGRLKEPAQRTALPGLRFDFLK